MSIITVKLNTLSAFFRNGVYRVGNSSGPYANPLCTSDVFKPILTSHESIFFTKQVTETI